MLKRPKPGDSEADLLRAQEEFLNSGAQPAVRVVHRNDKRSGEESSLLKESGSKMCQRDVVDIGDQDEMPPLAPSAPKKSRFKASRVHFEDTSPEEFLDRHDTHVTAVLSRIIERDNSSIPVSLPAFTTAAFPKVFHRSEVEDGPEAQVAPPGGRRSIFAQKLAAQRAQQGGVSSHCRPSLKPGAQGTVISPAATLKTAQPLPEPTGHTVLAGCRLVSGQGLSQRDSSQEALRIHQENQARLEGMSQREILEEQQKLLAQLDPSLVEFVRSRKKKGSAADPNRPVDPQGSLQPERTAADCAMAETDLREPEPDQAEMEEEEMDQPSQITVEELPVQPQKEWLHMDKLEAEKLEWLRDLPPPRRRGTERAMQARFDFNGNLIPPTEDLPTHLGLHHHGEEPELAGYSLQELFHFSRSQVTQQRSLAINTLARILTKARLGDFTSCLKGSVVSALLDAGLLFLLRFALDDSVEGVMAAAVHALRALLVAPGDEDALDSTFSWHLGMEAFPLLPAAQEEEEEDDEGVGEAMKERLKEERKTDHDVAREDVIKGLLRMKLLPRLRYILEVVRPAPPVVLDVLEVLTRIARHSSSSATQVLDGPRLMQTVMSEFLPCSWTPSPSASPESLHGTPVAAAMKLLRVLATSGAQACARLLHKLGATERLSVLLALRPEDLPLERREALSISTEALRLWAVAAGYGQGCGLYRDLYPLLLRALQCGPQEWDPADPLGPLKLQRLQALMTLLTNITLTAGRHQELLSACSSSQGAESPAPPPVDWSHVTGLQPSILGWLKGCVGALEEPAQRDSMLMLLPPQLLYLGAFYSQLTSQSCFRPVECLQELETLTAQVIQPLLSHLTAHGWMESLRSLSVLCNLQSCSPDPELIPSLPGLGCRGRRALAGSGSPLPLLTALCHLIRIVAGVHRGITAQFSALLLADPLPGYLRACCQARPTLSHASLWLLRHEHHFLYELLKLAHRLVSVNQEVAKHASLFHEVSMAMVSWLLPGSEHLAHDLLATVIFNPDFIPEGRGGGPEAAELSELQLRDQSSPFPHAVGPLLRDACAQLPAIRGCYLSHLASLEPFVLRSQNAHLGRTTCVRTRLLPEVSGPTLPCDWPFLPLVNLHERVNQEGGGGDMELLPPGGVELVTHCLQWLLLLQTWREGALGAVSPAAKLARLSCLFLCSSDLFLERTIQRLGWGLLRGLASSAQQGALDLGVPLPGVASFPDLYEALLTQYEAVSFGDPLFGSLLLLPLQRRYSAAMRLAVFGEHVGLLRSLGVPLRQLLVPLERYTSPPEDSLPLLKLYFRSLVTGTLRRAWCPVLYAVAVAHLNAFIFTQDPCLEEVEATRRGLLRKAYYLKDEVLKTHLLLFKRPQQESELGFEMYDQLPPLRARRLEAVVGVDVGGGVRRTEQDGGHLE